MQNYNKVLREVEDLQKPEISSFQLKLFHKIFIKKIYLKPHTVDPLTMKDPKIIIKIFIENSKICLYLTNPRENGTDITKKKKRFEKELK